jgi:hypothetical protein
LVFGQQIVFSHAKYLSAWLWLEGKDCHGVNTEYQCFKGRFDVSDIAYGSDEARLKRWYVSDLHEGVNVINVDLPHLESSNGVRVEGREVHRVTIHAEENVVPVQQLIPGILDTALNGIGNGSILACV